MMQAAQGLKVTVILILGVRMGKIKVMSWSHSMMSFKNLSGNLYYSHFCKFPPPPPVYLPLALKFLYKHTVVYMMLHSTYYFADKPLSVRAVLNNLSANVILQLLWCCIMLCTADCIVCHWLKVPHHFLNYQK